MKSLTNIGVPLEDIKLTISSSIGKTITINEYNRQRRITHQYTGIIMAVYDSVFLVEIVLNNYHIKKSFSYVNFSIGDMTYNFD